MRDIFVNSYKFVKLSGIIIIIVSLNIVLIQLASAEIKDDHKYAIQADGQNHNIYLEFRILDNKVTIESDSIIIRDVNYYIEKWDSTFLEKENEIIFEGYGTKGLYENTSIKLTLLDNKYTKTQMQIRGIIQDDESTKYLKDRVKILESSPIRVAQNEYPIESSEDEIKDLLIVSDHSIRVDKDNQYSLTGRIYDPKQYDKNFNILTPYNQNWGYIAGENITIEIIQGDKIIDSFNKTTNKYGYFTLDYNFPRHIEPGQYHTRITAGENKIVEKKEFFIQKIDDPNNSDKINDTSEQSNPKGTIPDNEKDNKGKAGEHGKANDKGEGKKVGFGGILPTDKAVVKNFEIITKHPDIITIGENMDFAVNTYLPTVDSFDHMLIKTPTRDLIVNLLIYDEKRDIIKVISGKTDYQGSFKNEFGSEQEIFKQGMYEVVVIVRSDSMTKVVKTHFVVENESELIEIKR